MYLLVFSSTLMTAPKTYIYTCISNNFLNTPLDYPQAVQTRYSQSELIFPPTLCFLMCSISQLVVPPSTICKPRSQNIILDSCFSFDISSTIITTTTNPIYHQVTSTSGFISPSLQPLPSSQWLKPPSNLSLPLQSRPPLIHSLLNGQCDLLKQKYYLSIPI